MQLYNFCTFFFIYYKYKIKFLTNLLNGDTERDSNSEECVSRVCRKVNLCDYCGVYVSSSWASFCTQMF